MTAKTIRSHTKVNAATRPSHTKVQTATIALRTVVMIVMTMLMYVVTANTIACHTNCATATIPFHTPVKNSPRAVNTVVATATMFAHASPRKRVNSVQIACPSSVCVKNHTMAATSATTAAMMRPMGLAVIAAFMSH
ncbi:hypothetical protein ACFPRL_30465 [Pseudoclavibacter helvolus]